MFFNTWGNLPLITGGQSRAINGENPRGEKGKGGMAASDLGPSRKGHPCWNDLQPGETAVLAEIEGPGVIQHMWFTVTDKTSDADCFVPVSYTHLSSRTPIPPSTPTRPLAGWWKSL